MEPHIIFRADASAQSGTGHIMRCLTLADRLAAHGATVRFLCSPETPAFVPRLTQAGYEVLDDLCPADLLIVDHYGLGLEYEQQVRPYFRHVMVIDDLPQRPHRCQILLDQTYGRTPQEWQHLVPQGTQILAGTQYLLLRPEFTAAAEPRQRLHRVLITLGGTDPRNVTQVALDGLQQSGLELDVHVVMGANAPHLSTVARHMETMPSAHLHVNVDNMAPLMMQADLAIGAGGTTAWERCSLGLPTLLLEIAANQRDVIAAITQAHAGVACPIGAPAIAAALRHLSRHPDELTHLSANARHMCSGHGTETAAQAILNLLRDTP